MADALSGFSGLASGIQWRDLVDQLSKVDQTRELDPITKQITDSRAQSSAWSSYQATADRLQAAAVALRDGTALSGFLASASASPTTNRALLSATTSAGATAGTYQVEVLDLARAEKLSGAAFASQTAAGGVSGDLAVNGRKVSILASDSLSGIRDKINAVNSGSFASGVTATVLGTASGSSRLVLSSDTPGARGIELVDSAAAGGVAQQLGLVDGSSVNASSTSGSATSSGFSSTEIAIGQMLGMSYPAPASIKVGNRTIMVDLERDSLSSLVAKLQAAGIGARTTTATEGGVTRSRLQIDAGVSAMPSSLDPATPDADSLRTLQMLGLVQGGRSPVAQTVASTALTTGAPAPASAGTLLTDINANGGSANIQAGDNIVLSGRRGDGTAVSLSYSVTATSTMADMLAQLNGASGFGSGVRSASAAIGSDGKVRLTDGTGGDSQLSLSLTVNKSAANGGGSTGIGSFGVETTGRLREVSTGSDARLRVDGVLMTRASNSVTDAIGGVTLALQQAEVGTTVNVDVTRNTDGALTAVKNLASAYNDLMQFVRTNTASTGALAFNGSLKASAGSFTRALLTDVVGASMARPTLAGLSLDKTGKLTVDAGVFTAAIKSDPGGVKALFALSGTVSGAGLEYIGSGDSTKAGSHDVSVTTLATVASITGSGATFPYADGGTVRRLNIADASSGIADSVVLASGDDATSISAKLNTLFQSKSMRLSASVSNGQLKIDGTRYGAAAAFTLGYDAGDVSSATQLGLAPGAYSGTDMVGTIDGTAAVGIGQTLTGGTGSAGDGLIIRYTGAATGAVGSASIAVGVGATFARYTAAITRVGDGTVAANVTALDRSVARLQTRGDTIAGRLDRRKQGLLKQFADMERAMSRIQAQGARIGATLNALSNNSSR